MTVDRLTRLARTLKHLRGSQIGWRLRYLLERRIPVTPQRAARWQWKGSGLPRTSSTFPDIPLFIAPDVTHQSLGLLQNGVFRFLNAEHNIGYDAPDWRLGPYRRKPPLGDASPLPRVGV